MRRPPLPPPFLRKERPDRKHFQSSLDRLHLTADSDENNVCLLLTRYCAPPRTAIADLIEPLDQAIRNVRVRAALQDARPTEALASRFSESAATPQ